MSTIGPETTVGFTTHAELPITDRERANLIAECERHWWKFIGEERVMVTEPPTTVVEELPVDLAAAIDLQLPQPYDYVPPTKLRVCVKGRGRVVSP